MPIKISRKKTYRKQSKHNSRNRRSGGGLTSWLKLKRKSKRLEPKKRASERELTKAESMAKEKRETSEYYKRVDADPYDPVVLNMAHERSDTICRDASGRWYVC